jgi:hypothetical protein
MIDLLFFVVEINKREMRRSTIVLMILFFYFFYVWLRIFWQFGNCFRASFSFQSHKPEPYQNLPVRRPTQADVNAKGRELMRHDSEHFAPFQVETSYSEDELDLVLEACENVTSSSCRSCLE